MTEIPEHLRKRAEEARKKAQEAVESGDGTFTGDDQGNWVEVVPGHYERPEPLPKFPGPTQLAIEKMLGERLAEQTEAAAARPLPSSSRSSVGRWIVLGLLALVGLFAFVLVTSSGHKDKICYSSPSVVVKGDCNSVTIETQGG